MPKNPYEWEIGSRPPLIDEHTKIKHKIYQDYIKEYIKTIVKKPAISSCKFIVVDAFAGGGLYIDSNQQEHSGSPVKIWEAIQEAEDEVNENRNKQFIVDRKLFLLEKEENTFNYLKNYLTCIEYDQHLDSKIILQKGAFVDKYQKIINKIHGSFGKNARAIFILDQYGYGDAPYSDIRKIFELLPKAEVILTLSVDDIIDYTPKHIETHRSNQQFLFDIKEAVKRKYELTQTRALDKVGLNVDNLIKMKKENPYFWRGAIEKLVTEKLVFFTQAKHYTPFFLNRKDSHKSIWIMHLTNHSEGVDVMKKVYHSYKNTEKTIISHYGGAGLDMLGYKHKYQDQPDLFGNTEYDFKEQSLNNTKNKLLEQIPKELYNQTTTFSKFYDNQTNGTPATRETLRGAFQELLMCKEIVVKNRNPTKSIKNNDIIFNNPQQRFFF